MVVVNASNTGNLTCSCQDRKKHWLRFAEPTHPQIRTSNICSAEGCFREFEIGGLVQKASPFGRADSELYIIPLCRECSHPSNTRPYVIRPSTRLAIADPNKTCSR